MSSYSSLHLNYQKMDCCTITGIQKIFINVVNVLLSMAGISGTITILLISTGAYPIFILPLVLSVLGICIGPVGIYSTLNDILWLIHSYVIAILLFSLTGIIASIACFLLPYEYSNVTYRSINLNIATSLLCGCLLTLITAIVTFRLARSLSKSTTGRSLEDPNTSAGKPLESPELPTGKPMGDS
jgi:hypothetical protein